MPDRNLGRWFAASITARYPAMLAIELSASKTCARVMRGMQSIAKKTLSQKALFLLLNQAVPKALIFLVANWSTSSWFCLGYRNDMSVLSGLKYGTSVCNGGRTLSTISKQKYTLIEYLRCYFTECSLDLKASEVLTNLAPASKYSSLRNFAWRPAPSSTFTANPFLINVVVTAGVTATLKSIETNLCRPLFQVSEL